jgi:hypothetical protein
MLGGGEQKKGRVILLLWFSVAKMPQFRVLRSEPWHAFFLRAIDKKLSKDSNQDSNKIIYESGNLHFQ